MKNFLLRILAKLVRTYYANQIPKIKDDNRPAAPFTLVYFCGSTGIKYLNASLLSVFINWKYLPELCIVTDGAPESEVREKMLKWPRKVTIITWKECAEYYKSIGNVDLYTYATKEIWGKKMVSILYLASKFPCFYSDTDVLWFSSPQPSTNNRKSVLKMSEDIDFCYSNEILEYLHEEKCLTTAPLNAGVIYASGDFSSYENWDKLCKRLVSKPDNRSEQTSFAILNNYYNPGEFWSNDEILIASHDKYSLKYTKTDYPEIIARHYAGIKSITFWRDYIYMKRNKA